MSHTLHAYLDAFLTALAQAGLQHVVISPGSRSAPLALLLAADVRFKIWMHYDERAAAFFALGLAKAQRFPVALVCTSGTAAANYYPAIIEAHAARVPLLVLTADRPPELRSIGAPQTIDQIKLYGQYAKWFMEMALPDAAPDLLRYAQMTATRAVHETLNAPAGVVHLNFPFREPLIPTPGLETSPALPPIAYHQPPVAVDLQNFLATHTFPARGLLFCGPQTDPTFPPAVAALSRALGYPLLADPLSQVRTGEAIENVIDAYDAFLRDAVLAETLTPEIVLRFGDWPTSKPLWQYLQRHPHVPHLLVTAETPWPDLIRQSSEIISAAPTAFCQALAAALPAPTNTAWLAHWQTINRWARTAIAKQLAVNSEPWDAGQSQSTINNQQSKISEPALFAHLAPLLPAHATLFVSSSMPVRDLDTFFPAQNRPMRVLANRGANGIDGVVSSALGASVASAGPTVLVIGDLALYHDLNGLLAAKLHGLRLTIILVNNDGGGIFSFLPQANHPEHFEQLFGTPHGLDFQHAAALYGLHYQLIADWATFQAAVLTSFQTEGVSLLELRTDRQQNVTAHRAVWQAVAEALKTENEPR